MLMHHPDPCADRVAGPVKNGRNTVNQNLAFVGVVQTAEHVHQRRFPGTILAQQAKNLTRADGQIDTFVGDDLTEPLGDAAKLDFHDARPALPPTC